MLAERGEMRSHNRMGAVVVGWYGWQCMDVMSFMNEDREER